MTKIPKIIHLTWFSGDEMPVQLKRCVDTWKRVLPDFEIKVWTGEMARELNIPFVNEALDARKWAFAGDVVRAYAVWKYGGVYMDTDVKVLKRFDEMLDKPMVFFIETNAKRWAELPDGVLDKDGKCLKPEVYILGRQIQAAMFMGKPGQKCLGEIVDFYRNRHFIKPDGSQDHTISPTIYAKILEKYGFRYKDEDQILDVDGSPVYIYSSKYVVLNPYETHRETVAIHLGTHAWDPRSPWREFKYRIKMSFIGPWLSKHVFKHSRNKKN